MELNQTCRCHAIAFNPISSKMLHTQYQLVDLVAQIASSHVLALTLWVTPTMQYATGLRVKIVNAQPYYETLGLGMKYECIYIRRGLAIESKFVCTYRNNMGFSTILVLKTTVSFGL